MSAGAESPPAREHVGGVIGVGLGLLLLLLLVLGLLSQRTRSLDAAELYAGWFEAGELPFGLVVVEAARQKGGETMLLLSDPQAPAEAPRAEVPGPDRSRGSAATEGAPEHEPFDWRSIEEGPRDRPPSDALLMTWPRSVAVRRLESLFGGGGPEGSGPGGGGPGRGMGLSGLAVHDPIAELGPDGGRVVLERGRLPWGALEAPYVLERKYEAGGTFVDTLRVNLSSETEALVLFLRWQRGLPAARERAEELLEHLHRAPPAP